MNKRAKVVISVVTMLLLLLVVSWIRYSIKYPGAVRFEEVYQSDTNEIHKLRMRSGSTGEARTTEEKERIGVFLDIMERARFVKDKDQRLRMGWRYYVDLFESVNEDEWFRINFTRVRFERSGKQLIPSPYYRIENEDEIMDELTAFYESIK